MPDRPATAALARLLAQRYAEALRDAEPVEAEAVISDALQAGFDGTAICARVISPGMRWIGDLWETNSITVADEHLATATTHYLLGRLQPALFPPPPKMMDASALLACAEGERHALGLSMVANALRSRGWHVLELGADVPTEFFAAALARHSPQLVGLSATMSSSTSSFHSALECLTRIRPQAQVILGGNGVPSQLRRTHRWVADVEQALQAVPSDRSAALAPASDGL